MIEYIKHEQQMTYIYQDTQIEKQKQSVMFVIKKLCLEHLTTYEGYVKAIQNKYDKHHLIPLILSNELSLIPIMRVREYDNIWINACAIKSIKTITNGVMITFLSENTLKIDKNISFLKNSIIFANTIKKEKVKHFHA